MTISKLPANSEEPFEPAEPVLAASQACDARGQGCGDPFHDRVNLVRCREALSTFLLSVEFGLNQSPEALSEFLRHSIIVLSTLLSRAERAQMQSLHQDESKD